MDIQGVENVAIDKRAPREQYVSSNCRDKGQSWGARLQWLPVTTTKGQYQNTDRKQRPRCPGSNNRVRKISVRHGTVPPKWVFWLAKTTTTATIPLHSKQASAPWTSKPQADRRGNEKGLEWEGFYLFSPIHERNVPDGERALRVQSLQ